MSNKTIMWNSLSLQKPLMALFLLCLFPLGTLAQSIVKGTVNDEALLLYAEACIGADEASGLKALNEVQQRFGSGKISSSLTFNEGKPGYKKEHKLFTTYAPVDYNDFSDKYKYLPFPLKPRLANHFQNVLGWESLNGAE